jgi:hypothetical protein
MKNSKNQLGAKTVKLPLASNCSNLRVNQQVLVSVECPVIKLTGVASVIAVEAGRK